MIKRLVIVLITLFILLPAAAQAEEDILGVYGGVQYNTHKFNYHNELAEQMEYGQKINGGLGGYAGLRGWLSDRLAIGVEAERMQVDAEAVYLDNEPAEEDDEIKYWAGKNFSALTDGLLSTITYKLSEVGTSDSEVLAIIGLGKYWSTIECEAHLRDRSSYYDVNEQVTCWGGKAGVETKQKLMSNLIFSGRLMYRSADIKTDLEANYGGHNAINFSGFEFSGNLTLAF